MPIVDVQRGNAPSVEQCGASRLRAVDEAAVQAEPIDGVHGKARAAGRAMTLDDAVAEALS